MYRMTLLINLYIIFNPQSTLILEEHLQKWQNENLIVMPIPLNDFPRIL